MRKGRACRIAHRLFVRPSKAEGRYGVGYLLCVGLCVFCRMASITYSNVKKYRYFGQDEEAPEESPGESLRQRLLKELVQKQLSTHTSLDQQRHNQRKFVKAACEESVTGSTSGLASFESFRSVESLLHVRQTLKSCGLTDAEIRLLLDGESESSPLEAPYARRQRLEAIEEKLARHKKQLGGSLDTPEQTSDAEAIDYCLGGTSGGPVLGKVEHPPRHQDFLPAAHPMNHLKELAEELFPTQEPTPSHSQEPARKRQQDKMAELTTPKRNRTEASQCIYLTEKPESYWDMRQIPKVLEPSTRRMSGPLPQPPQKTTATTTRNKDAPLHVTKKNEVKPADQTKPFIMTLDPGDLTPLAVIEANRRSVHELKEMEKFKHYEEGTPSRTLYIKNLSARVSPKDLGALMGHFESSDGPKILYRILGGRMKGQAFVTFPDEEAASKALSVCNGYILHDRPMVAVYGKKT